MKKATSEHELYHCLENFPVFRVCISGGPCGGKTTLLDKVREEFTKKGFKVITMPEVPTLVHNAGININTYMMPLEDKLTLEASILKLKIILEDQFFKMAQSSTQPVLILNDRGTMDSCAYVTEDEFATILDNNNWSIINLRDKRYDAIVFLTTAADGAQQFYSLANNEARHENLEESKQLDLRTLQAWNGHPNLIIVENVKGQPFDKKMSNAINSIQKALGIYTKSITNRQFLLQSAQIPKNINAEILDVQQIVLSNSNPQKYFYDKIRKRGLKGTYNYRRTIKYKSQNGQQVTTIKTLLKPVQYLSLAQSSGSSDHLPLKKIRTQFLYNKQSFVVDKILLPDPILILKYADKEGSIVTIPDFLKVSKQITQNPDYFSVNLARKTKKQ